jgi:pyruvate carboxylase subunit B
MWNISKSELKEHEDIELTDENIMTYLLYPQVGLKFLKGNMKPEFKSDELPLSINHKLTRSMVKQSFPEIKEIWLEDKPPEQRSGPAKIPTEFEVEVDGEPYEVKVKPTGGFLVSGTLEDNQDQKNDIKNIEGGILSNMQGTILKIIIKKGDKISKGDIIATIEAMKMEQEIKSDKSGIVKDIFIKEGDSVTSGDLLIQVL